MRSDRYRVRVACLAALLLVTTAFGVTQSSRIAQCQDGCRTLAASADLAAAEAAPPAPTPATVRVLPQPGAQGVLPRGPVRVTAFTGTLTDVTMVNENGTVVPGVLTPDRTVWKPAVPLGYGREYTLTVRSQGPGGMPAAETSSFTTVSPSYQASVSLTTTGYALLKDGGTYGVGTVVVARFDEPIADRARAERQLAVTTSPPVQGSWYWVDDQTAHWRPERYYAPGTTVTVAANIYGVPLGNGVYGEDDEKVSFKIGDAHVSIADDNTKQVSVFDNGELVRTMPTSMGRGGTETIGGTTLSFWTPPGVYTVLDKANPVIMDSSSYGLPVNSRLGYRETIPWATRISGDGIYLHQLNATVWAQGNTNTSHGCLNLNSENAEWFFNFSVPGDVVEVRHTGGPPQDLLSQNGDWSVPWDQWRKGSALAA
ncbi:L,D-transpeptidase [Mycolicibacterium sp. J2]|uniref:L,D-transpeptidase n=1 Tax=Mycolicibacterium sp. J2 TaxID=2993511 RepID=UPI003A4DA298